MSSPTKSNLKSKPPVRAKGASASFDCDDAADMGGHLLKQAKRGRHWNDRYFKLSGNTFSYYHAEGDVNPKGCFTIALGKTIVSNLFMDQRQTGTTKELLYCFRLSFEENAHSWHNDDGSTQSLTKSPERVGKPQVNLESGVEGQQDLDDRQTPEREKSVFRLSTAKSSSRFKRKPLAPSLDEPEATTKNRIKRKPSKSKPLERSVSIDRPDFVPPPEQRQQQQQEHNRHHSWTDGFDDSYLKPTQSSEEDEKRLSYFEEQRREEQEQIQSHFLEAQKEHKKKTRKQLIDGGKYAVAAGAAVTVGILTAGVGILAGLVFLGAGAAAGGTGVVGGAAYQRMKKRGELVVASPNYEEMRRWKSALDACLVSESVRDSTWGQLFVMDGRSAKTALMPTEVTNARSLEWSSGTVESPPRSVPYQQFEDGHHHKATTFVDSYIRWQPMEGGWTNILGTGTEGLRIFREERNRSHPRTSVKENACPPLKAQTVLHSSPIQAFFCIMSLGRMSPDAPIEPNSGQRASFHILERMDDHTDVIHLCFRPQYLFPSWTTPRDFVLFRYWRYEPDGSYVICVDSIKHPKCPPHPGYTRGDMHGVYNIAPKKRLRGNLSDRKTESIPIEECLLTAVVQVDPRGWVPMTYMTTYGEAFGVSALLQLLDVKDALEQERFVPHLDFSNPSSFSYRRLFVDKPPVVTEEDPYNYDFSYASHEASYVSTKWISCHPPPLCRKKWAQPDANSFRVRGKSYLKDHIKINAGSSIARLIAVDMVQSDKPIYSGLSTQPTERIHLALEREKRNLSQGLPSDTPPFIFLVNIVLPGPPFYHAGFYYAIDDMSTIDGTDGTPSSKLCQQFFFGKEDSFRDKTFKMIPTIVEGNFVVRKAVGSTPAIMGTKLRQLYVQNDRFFEVILDCGSSSVATGVIRLSLGYAKTLVCDLGFVFEGNDASTLPERIFGCARMKYPEFGPEFVRKINPVEPPQQQQQVCHEKVDGEQLN